MNFVLAWTNSNEQNISNSNENFRFTSACDDMLVVETPPAVVVMFDEC